MVVFEDGEPEPVETARCKFRHALAHQSLADTASPQTRRDVQIIEERTVLGQARRGQPKSDKSLNLPAAFGNEDKVTLWYIRPERSEVRGYWITKIGVGQMVSVCVAPACDMKRANGRCISWQSGADVQVSPPGGSGGSGGW